MITILCWIVYGLVVGGIAKLLHPGEEPVGCLPTIGIGVAGSFVGGAINWLLGYGDTPFQASGIIMGILGGIVFCALYQWYKVRNGNKS